MTKLRLARLLAALLVLLTGGCDSALGLDDVAATYVLESVNGAPLPVVMMENGAVRTTLLADTLRLRPNGTGTDVTVHRVEYPGTGAADQVSSFEMRVFYRIRDGGIDIQFTCPPEVLCLAVVPPTIRGRFTADGLILDMPHPGEYAYRRID